ncbi:hypothetical protein [Bradyrhizobium liaoningense]|uniref:hypothetical protein n=1 Tax=Bradyrhizobium liaoningense TaxID=43992 RepID=UPI001BACBBF0|nr:hypothetical protein [Bradyrhizobium liaoningense]MBR0715725.1 hypothetical protein [Bradyrhizobium liaoningense]
MFSIRRPKGVVHLRNWRGLLAVLVATLYLLSGTLHGIYDVDVSASSGQSDIVTVLGAASGHADHKAIAGHHCHGCFSVAVAQAVLPVTPAEPVTQPASPRLPALAGIVPDTDSPPPKHLT